MAADTANLIQLTGDLPGTPDFELRQPRQSRVTWRATLPRGEANGLVLILPGFGPTSNVGYAAKLAAHAATAHGWAALDVDYHCRRARPENGCAFAFDAETFYKTAGLAAMLGIDVTGCTQMAAVLDRLRPHASRVAGIDPLPKLAGTLVPPDGDYQNFGVMQVLDVAAAVRDFQQRQQIAGPVIALGSSHGGYLAHMLHRVAPGLLSGLIDNSSYTRTIPAYVGQGVEYWGHDAGLKIGFNTMTRWQHADPNQPTYFGPVHRHVRDVGDAELLVQTTIARRAAGAGPLQIRACHSTADKLADPAEKQQQANLLRTLGHEVQLTMVGEADLDGKKFKSLDHGLGASLKTLLDDALPTFRDTGGDGDALAAYEFDGMRYEFAPDHAACGPIPASRLAA
jgi:hypothetical protein